MATWSQSAPATTAAAGSGSGTRSTTGQTIAGFHVLKIDNFSATKDLGVGKSIKSSTFRVGGHGWYIECYPCGVDSDSDGWVSLYLCRQDDHHDSEVSAECIFTLMESLEENDFDETISHPDGHSRWGTDFMERAELESVLKDDCFQARCTVSVWIDKFPADVEPQWDLATKSVAGSHVLTIDDYSKTREVLAVGDAINSCSFPMGGLWWFIKFYPCGEHKSADSVAADLCLDLYIPGASDEAKVRFEMTLLTHAEQIISSFQSFHTFTKRKNAHGCSLLGEMEHESSPLVQDGIKIRCDMAIVEGITAMLNQRQGTGGDLHGIQQVRIRGDVTFKVGGHLFPAHKCVLATRCTAFMAEFFGQTGMENAGATDHHERIIDMEPKAFEALLHFIYTDTLPEVQDDDKIVMVQGLLVAADRYAMERLKLICADMLCSYVNDARTAVATLELAVKHGCRRLMEKCMELIKGHFANVAP